MSAFIKIDQVAGIFGVSEPDARIIARFHGVETKDGDKPINPKNGKPFGNPCKLYNQDQVDAVANSVSVLKAGKA